MEESIKGLNQRIKEAFEIKGQDIRSYSPLTLAFIGDAVYEIIVRTLIVNEANAPVNKLHKKSSTLVKAAAQAEIMHSIYDELTEAEEYIYKRGRNAKAHSVAKNASVTDYRTATGFEALMGYLYLDNQTGRILKLVRQGIDSLNQQV